jgi:hypothetical protein
MMELTINTNEIFHAGDRGDGARGVTSLGEVLYGTDWGQSIFCNLVFTGGDGGEVGKLTWEDGKLHFEGNADESARIFLDHVIGEYMRY